MLILRNLSYIHPDKELLFDNINLTVNAYDYRGTLIVVSHDEYFWNR